MMVKVPGKSICKSFSLMGAGTGFEAGGAVKKKKIIAAAIPPIGRLM
jgi:hypothetical protein